MTERTLKGLECVKVEQKETETDKGTSMTYTYTFQDKDKDHVVTLKSTREMGYNVGQDVDITLESPQATIGEFDPEQTDPLQEAEAEPEPETVPTTCPDCGTGMICIVDGDKITSAKCPKCDKSEEKDLTSDGSELVEVNTDDIAELLHEEDEAEPEQPPYICEHPGCEETGTINMPGGEWFCKEHEPGEPLYPEPEESEEEKENDEAERPMEEKVYVTENPPICDSIIKQTKEGEPYLCGLVGRADPFCEGEGCKDITTEDEEPVTPDLEEGSVAWDILKCVEKDMTDEEILTALTKTYNEFNREDFASIMNWLSEEGYIEVESIEENTILTPKGKEMLTPEVVKEEFKDIEIDTDNLKFETDNPPNCEKCDDPADVRTDGINLCAKHANEEEPEKKGPPRTPSKEKDEPPLDIEEAKRVIQEIKNKEDATPDEKKLVMGLEVAVAIEESPDKSVGIGPAYIKTEVIDDPRYLYPTTKKGEPVVHNIGVEEVGGSWGTFWTSKSGGFHKIGSPALPMRPTREEALADLTAFAEKKKLEKVTTISTPEEMSVGELKDKLEDSRLPLIIDDVQPPLKDTLAALTNGENIAAPEQDGHLTVAPDNTHKLKPLTTEPERVHLHGPTKDEMQYDTTPEPTAEAEEEQAKEAAFEKKDAEFKEKEAAGEPTTLLIKKTDFPTSLLGGLRDNIIVEKNMKENFLYAHAQSMKEPETGIESKKFTDELKKKTDYDWAHVIGNTFTANQKQLNAEEVE